MSYAGDNPPANLVDGDLVSEARTFGGQDGTHLVSLYRGICNKGDVLLLITL